VVEQMFRREWLSSQTKLRPARHLLAWFLLVIALTPTGCWLFPEPDDNASEPQTPTFAFVDVETDWRPTTSDLYLEVNALNTTIAGGGSSEACRYGYETSQIQVNASTDRVYTDSDFRMPTNGYADGYYDPANRLQQLRTLPGRVKSKTQLGPGWLELVSLERFRVLKFNPYDESTPNVPPPSEITLGVTYIYPDLKCKFDSDYPFSMVFQNTCDSLAIVWKDWLIDEGITAGAPTSDAIVKSTVLHELMHAFAVDSLDYLDPPYPGNSLCHDDQTGTYQRPSDPTCECVMNKGSSAMLLLYWARKNNDVFDANRAEAIMTNWCLCPLHRYELNQYCPFTQLVTRLDHQ
jgi:hypothetical protein